MLAHSSIHDTRTVRRWAVALVIAVGTALAVPTAHADEPMIPVAGGSSIIVGDATRCTLTAVGLDRHRNLLALTAAHCGNPGNQVRSTTSGRQLGEFVAEYPELDVAVILLSPGAATIDPAAPRTVPTPAEPGALGCMTSASGRDCAPIFGELRSPIIVTWLCSRPGDSGAPVVIQGRLAGMNAGEISLSAAIAVPLDLPCRDPDDRLHNPAYMFAMNDILHRLARVDGIGGGFVPTA